MTRSSPNFELLRSPWGYVFERLLSRAEDRLLLASPFIKVQRALQVASKLEQRGVDKRVHVSVLTDVRPESALSGATDLEALVNLCKALPNCRITHLPSLHAKVYVADNRIAIITSANLTDSGIEGNVEYGVVLTDKATVSAVRQDFDGYAALGADIAPADVHGLADEIGELKKLYGRAQQTVRARARRIFQEKLNAARVRILRYRAKGTSTNAIFSETIRFLLSKHPIRTTELHPLIQRIHPDLCDDAVDRVIEGVHFGKKWKHHVRNAQQQLKRQGQITFDGER